MLATRDQENLVHGHQQAAASKPLNQNTRGIPPKTPGSRFPKTPLKVPLRDENEPVWVGRKSVLGTKGKGLENLVTVGKNTTLDKNAFITPMGPRNRAPLGMKTTNAKTKAVQTPAGSIPDKDLQKTQPRPTSARRAKPKVLHAEKTKLDVRDDDVGPLEEREVEYCPPKPKDLPYESEDFPDRCLDYDILKGPNMMRVWQSYYLDPVDENGVSIKEKQFEESLAKAFRETDEKVLKAVEEQEWTVGDVPETFINARKKETDDQRMSKVNEQAQKSSVLSSKGPATVTSRKAASALSVIAKAPLAAPKTTNTTAASKTSTSLLALGRKPKAPIAVNPSTMRHTAAAAVSRSTIGYRKGRNASNVLKMGTGVLPRSTSNLSAASDTTLTPASYAQKEGSELGADEWIRLKLLGAFDTDDEDLEPGLRGVVPECLRSDEEIEEEFVLTLSGI